MILFFLVGFFVSLINSIAGGGSTLSLPTFLLLGVPADIANGSNRFGVIWGNLASYWKLRKFKPKGITSAILWVLLGSLLGAQLAVRTPNNLFETMLGVVLLFITAISLFGKKKEIEKKWSKPIQIIALFGAGFYGGFIQVGVGFILIFVLRGCFKGTLLETNAVKALLGFFFISLSFFVFWYKGLVDWNIAIPMALGCVLGGYSGAFIQLKVNEKWVTRCVSFLAIAMACKLLYKTTL